MKGTQMVVFAKILCWIAIVVAMGLTGYSLQKARKTNFTGTDYTLACVEPIINGLVMIFKGIVGLQLLNAGVLSTGNIWFLLILVIVPTNSIWAIACDFFGFLYLSTLLPGVSADNPPKLACLLATLLVVSAIVMKLVQKRLKAMAVAVENANQPKEQD